MHQKPETQTQPNESAIRHRLAMMWFADIYPQYVREDATVSSSTSVPPEYLAPYPNPWYWPKNNPQTKQAQKTESRPTALEAGRAASAVQSKTQAIIYPSWLEFWEGKVPEYPLPEIPNVIIPDIPPSKFMEVFRETQGLRVPYRKIVDTDVKSDEMKNNISTAEGLVAVRGADYRVPWITEKMTGEKENSSAQIVLKNDDSNKVEQTDGEVFTIKWTGNIPLVDSKNLGPQIVVKRKNKRYRSVGKKGHEILVPVEEGDELPVDENGDPINKLFRIERITTFSPEFGEITIETEFPVDPVPVPDTPIDYGFHWPWEDGTHNWNLGGEEEIIDINKIRTGLTTGNENFYEEICCAGLNPDDGFLEAIITIKELEGYSGGLCWPGSFESVGFWLTEPSDTEENANYWTPGGGVKSIWVGEASVKVHDIPRHKDDDVIVGNQVLGHLNYTVRVQLTEENKKYIRKCYERNAADLSLTRLPTLHCVLAWNRKVVEADINHLLGWGDVKDYVVQFPVLGAWVDVLNQKKYSLNYQGPIIPTHVAALPDGTVLIFRYEWQFPFDELFAINESNINRTKDIDMNLHPSGFEVYEAALENVKSGKPVKFFDGKETFDKYSVGRTQCKIYRPYFIDQNWDALPSNVFETIEPPLRREDNIAVSKEHDEEFLVMIGVKRKVDAPYEPRNAKKFLDELRREIESNNTTTVYYYFRRPNIYEGYSEYTHQTITDKIILFQSIATQLDHEDSRYFPTFCSGHSVLYNGNVFIMGGTLGRVGHAEKGFEQDLTHNHHDLGINETVQYDWTKREWISGPNMKNGRWYPSSVAMPDKSVVILDGHPQENYEEYHSNVDIDFYNPNFFFQLGDGTVIGGAIITLPNTGALWSGFGNKILEREMLSEYSRIFLLPDGSIFSATAVYSFYDPHITYRDYYLYDPASYYIEGNSSRLITNELQFNYSNNEQSNDRWLTQRLGYDINNNFGTLFLPWTMRYIPVYDQWGNPTMEGYWQKVSNTIPGRGNYNESTGALLPLTINNRWMPTVLMIEHSTAWICSPLRQPYLSRIPGKSNFSDRSWRLLQPQRLEEFRYKSRRNGAMVLLADGTALLAGGSTDNVYGQPDGIKGANVKGSKYYKAVFDDWRKEDVKEKIGFATQTLQPYDFNSLLGTEIFNPFINKWLKGAELKEVRGYHSSYILLFDGSVLIGGGEPIGSAFSRNPDLYADVEDDPFFHEGFVRNFERYYPEYCSKPRPFIKLIGNNHYYNASKNHTIIVQLVGENTFQLTIERVGLIRLSSATHGFVYDQRYVEMEYRREGDFVNINIPAKFDEYNYLNVLPPGPYFIFIVFTNGWVSQMQPWEMIDGQNNIPMFTVFIE